MRRASQEQGVRDANGNVLYDGDTVSVIKDLKVDGLVIGRQRGNQGERHPSGGCGSIDTTFPANLTASAR